MSKRASPRIPTGCPCTQNPDRGGPAPCVTLDYGDHIMIKSAWLSVGFLLIPICVVWSDVRASLLADLHSPAASVRRATAIKLARHPGRETVDALIGAMDDSDPRVQAAAAKSLGQLKDVRATESLIKALTSNDMHVRFYAAYALGELRAAAALSPLCKALDDSQWPVRDQAAWALRAIGDRRAVPHLVRALRADRANVDQIGWILKQFNGTDTVKQLVGLMTSGDSEQRYHAMCVLHALRNPSSVAALRNALRDPDARVRREAAQSLGDLEYRDALVPLQQQMTHDVDPAARQAAGRAVARLTHQDALAGYWSFDKPDGDLVHDQTGHGNQGRMSGCHYVDGKFGKALRFENEAFVEFGRPANLDMANRPLTVMAWVRTEAPNGVVVARGGKFCGFSLYIKDGLPKFGIHCVQDGPSHIAAAKQQAASQWIHLAGIVHRDRIELYVDGKLASQTKTDGYIPGNCGQGMEIGYDVSNSPAEITDHFEGVIDEVRIYQAAFSAADIKATMQLSQGGGIATKKEKTEH